MASYMAGIGKQIANVSKKNKLINNRNKLSKIQVPCLFFFYMHVGQENLWCHGEKI